MATTRSQVPVTNLKERIAALEQRNSVSSTSSRATSPPPGTAPANGAVAPGFRDKIAKFEKKGGVPVPRGSFGLGAPPAIEGPRKRGELYGNRIPAPARAFSSGALPDASRATSPTFTEMQSVGSPGTSPTSTVGDRRSFSLSSVTSDEARDYTPISSPTLGYPPDSPESVGSRSPVDVSPSLDSLGDIPVFNKPLVRGTSFQKAMEVAKNAEIAKAENPDSIAALLAQQQSPDDTNASQAGGEALPTIVISLDVTAPSDALAKQVTSTDSKTTITEPGPEAKVERVDHSVLDKVAKSEVALPVHPLIIQKRTQSHELGLEDVSGSVSSAATDKVEDMRVSSEVLQVKAKVTLDSTALEGDLIDSPLDTGNASALSITDMLGDFFTKNADGIVRPVTPPTKSSAAPSSPLATLAYDSPESSEKERQGKPPTIAVPDSQDFLSPPPTGTRASVPSSGSSLGSLGSLGSRPMSMIEAASFTQVSRAMRMTPATGRGVPMFLPPSSAVTRKSDFVYFPPTPTDDDDFNQSSSSENQPTSSDSRRVASESSGLERAATFTAVVHGKVREPPVSAPASQSSRPSQPLPPMPRTPQVTRVKHYTMEPPLSPASGELAALLQEAVLLEDSLDRGELPTEAMDAKEVQMREKEIATAAEAKRKEEEDRQRIAVAAARLQAKRDEPTSGMLKHTFLVPLAKARSVHAKEVSAPALSTPTPNQAEDVIARPKSAGVPDVATPTSSTNAKSSAHARRSATPESDKRTVQQQQQHLETPPKSAKTSRFAGFRRLGSITARPNTIHGHSTRTSVSTMSSDSTTVATPSDGTLEFSISKQPSVSEFGGLSANGSTTSFPSLSSKKSSTSIGRAASFAERVFSRSRTKSNGSVLSSTSEMTDRIPEDTPTLPTLPTIDIGPTPSTPAIVVPVSDTEVKVIQPPRRSASLARSSRLPPPPAESVPPLPVITPSAFFSTTPATQPPGTALLLPTTGDDARPSSWTSMSSAGSLGSLPSPLFDTALFDAFPSVPANTPIPHGRATSAYYPHQRSLEQTLAYERPSFDSDLLSSAIHLANTRKPSAGPPSRPSGESAR